MKKAKSVSGALSWAVTALVLVVCLLLPLLFRGDGTAEVDAGPTTYMSAGERAELYRRYAADEGLALTQLDGSSVGDAELVGCMRLVNSVMNLLVMDDGSIRTDGPSGTNFYTLSDNGRSIRIMEYYREWTADWHNWFTIHVDLDTQEIYYLYYSANVQQNGGEYAGRAEEHLENAGQNVILALGFTDDAALNWRNDNEWELELTNSSDDVYHYQVICNIYEDAAPSLLIDLRLTLTEIS